MEEEEEVLKKKGFNIIREGAMGGRGGMIVVFSNINFINFFFYLPQ